MNKPQRIALFGQHSNKDTLSVLEVLVPMMQAAGVQLQVEKKLAQATKNLLDQHSTFANHDQLDKQTDVFFSVGGDGSMLRSLTYVRDAGIPILGINTGRLGFLASLKKEDIQKGISDILNGDFDLEERSLLEVQLNPPNKKVKLLPYALNEVVVSRKNTTSMIQIETMLDQNYLNTYWADGLMLATPTGSTGYSLSCGGPVMAPNSRTWVLTPIAPHNLNARPLVLADDTQVTLKVSCREEQHLISLDSRIVTVNEGTVISIQKAAFTLKLVQLRNNRFFETLRRKMLWGEDTRN